MKKSDINRIIKQAKKLAKTKTEDELFEIIGKEKIPFKDKFKIGDIICSDRFHNGLCMVVERFNPKDIWEDSFTCQDLVTDNQKWRAYENEKWRAYENDKYMFFNSYNWRIATDDDIAKYLSRFLDIPLGKVGEFYIAKLTDDGIMLDNLVTYGDVHLGVEELVDLKRIIDERVG